MKYADLERLYIDKQKVYKDETYKHVSEILITAKIMHKLDWDKKPTKGNDHEQSWKAFKGKNYEKLIQFILKNEVEKIGLKIINGNFLERSKNLSTELDRLKRNLAVDFGEFGLHLPDVDIIIYDPKKTEVIAVISSKITLRERITQTGYWKLKLLQSDITKNIKVFFVTPDEDGTLSNINPPKKGRAIVEIDTDGAYVMTETEIEESDKVKMFGNLITDLLKIYNEYEQ